MVGRGIDMRINQEQPSGSSADEQKDFRLADDAVAVEYRTGLVAAGPSRHRWAKSFLAGAGPFYAAFKHARGVPPRAISILTSKTSQTTIAAAQVIESDRLPDEEIDQHDLPFVWQTNLARNTFRSAPSVEKPPGFRVCTSCRHFRFSALGPYSWDSNAQSSTAQLRNSQHWQASQELTYISNVILCKLTDG